MEGVSHVENRVYVAVGKNVKEGKSLLSWAVKRFKGWSVCLLHVHQATHLVSILDQKLSSNKFKRHAIKAFQELELRKMHKLLNEYILFVSQMGVQADNTWIEMSNIGKGILQLIVQHGIKWLIMGAGAETLRAKQRTVDFVSCLATTLALPSPINNGETILVHDWEDNTEDDAGSVQSLKHSTRSMEKAVDTSNSTIPMIDWISGDDSPLFLQASSPEHFPCSSSIPLLDYKLQEEETHDLRNNLEHAVIDAENYKQRAFEESVKLWRAEEDAIEATRKAEELEILCMEEINRKNKIEEILFGQRVDIEAMKNQLDQFVKELQLIQHQKPALESQLREACCIEKELEEKIIQAVNLLITYKEKRDKLQMEYDSATREANKLRTFTKDDPMGICSTQFFGFSFVDIIEATQNFNPSQKIGEGRCGIVYKGMLNHVKVAIKMLPFSGHQSDSEFMHEVEVLSRVRHPNLVMLIGACPASRSLIYEYIENGSLEDQLICGTKSRPLAWQYRIRIATEICSVLIFLHANSSCIIHGNLKSSNVLLDSSFVSKVGDLGISNFVSNQTLYRKNDPAILISPEIFDDGELTAESDVYSFGIVLLQLLTAKPAFDLVRDVKCAIESGHLNEVLDVSAGDWPVDQAKQLAHLALWCCESKRSERPNLDSEVWAVLEAMRDSCTMSSSTSCSSSLDSKDQRRIPSYFVCPIFQEIMKDPHIAADGFTYEGDAIKGWFNSGHETSPMTNLKLEHTHLLPNNALYNAIQEWQQQS
ncbi:U-box domain-containing protein 32-like isoform X2 [Olea europaea var. sylvestris]|uniref:U-box domain-containing protein 32-like isoform X2 n=1 Tax=Olea europaea var. sylvestris TaxID=158386 RepID=UPI000C1CD12F|nr:U-box domain-containing protein 32-like isoform X2 [Olea europaea var. sylvestris]